MTLTAQGALDIHRGYPYITRGSEFLYQRDVTIFFNTALNKIVLGFIELNSGYLFICTSV